VVARGMVSFGILFPIEGFGVFRLAKTIQMRGRSPPQRLASMEFSVCTHLYSRNCTRMYRRSSAEQDSFKVMSSTLQYHSEAKFLVKQPW
jgi:hypothetical protein